MPIQKIRERTGTKNSCVNYITKVQRKQRSLKMRLGRLLFEKSRQKRYFEKLMNKKMKGKVR